MATTVLATLLALALAVPYFTRTPTVPTTVRFSVDLATQGGTLGGFALSPHGTRLVFVDRLGEQLWLRTVGELDAEMLPGTENAAFPFWSPDGRSIGFFTSGELRTVDLIGGPPQTVCSVSVGLGGTWNQDDVILFGRLGGDLFSSVCARWGADSA